MSATMLGGGIGPRSTDRNISSVRTWGMNWDSFLPVPVWKKYQIDDSG